MQSYDQLADECGRPYTFFPPTELKFNMEIKIVFKSFIIIHTELN